AERAIANTERDHAQLSEATALLDKDPTRALALLDSIPLHTPRHALLRSRASHGAASRVVRVPDSVAKLRIHPTTSAIAIMTGKGELAMLDPERGELRPVDRDLLGPMTWRADHWIYARRSFGAKTVTVAATTTPQQLLDAGSLLTVPTSTLLS